jgi:PKD repeat protein
VNSFEYALAYTKVTVDPAAGTATAQVIRVADVSTDLKSITTVYPAGTVFETVVMTNAKPPAANFTAEPEAGTMPLTVQFTDTTSGTAPFTYAWNFGDDGTSTGQSPSHTYTTYGIYTVTLTATNSAGADTETKVGFITVNQLPPDAIFTADPLSGTVPLTVQFTDHSLYAETWAWDFANDGTVDSTDQSPSHIYDTAGTYTVNLTVINTVGSSTQFTTITVLPPLPSADFTATPASGVAPLIVQFTDASTGATSWSWAFGDGATSTSQNPSHTYTTGGTYTATLTVTNAAGTSTKDMQITVTIQPLVADFAANKTSGTVPLTVAFTDASTGSPASWAWVFGDGTTSTEKNPVHKFTTAGTYTVTMTATNDGGSSSKSMTITVNPKKPVARFDQNKYSGKIPLTVKFTDKSTNNPTSYLWRFGDGTTSMEKNPSHAYTKAGVYVVRLTATNSGGSDDATSLVAALPKWWPW